MKKVIEIVNKVMDKIVNAVKKQGSCVECGEKIHPAQRLCDDCSAHEEMLIAEQMSLEAFEAALKVQGPIEPDFDNWFNSWNVQDAYTDWAYSPDCPGLMEVAERNVPFAMGTPEYRKAVEMINRKIQEEIQMMREAREKEALRAEEALL
ncbi:hypothetical protein GCM10007416_31620 [Kroppenstedtia guangzhouensis]|uniref:Uncharacterized protein n=1 Tax=Kroppenstedtia guangzhouensis TaxID=1274356 RepID=A0ABQ1H349_9BACL|nr:hypothetical protein [Kroppenstedtia guangzhouensis]GGA56118.1 hypothetical protein GCM10007416_31620 [Kroppenstedtia guangzhouensis]